LFHLLHFPFFLLALIQRRKNIFSKQNGVSINLDCWMNFNTLSWFDGRHHSHVWPKCQNFLLNFLWELWHVLLCRTALNQETMFCARLRSKIKQRKDFCYFFPSCHKNQKMYNNIALRVFSKEKQSLLSKFYQRFK
jgi:hypothetical protein